MSLPASVLEAVDLLQLYMQTLHEENEKLRRLIKAAHEELVPALQELGYE